MKILITGGAGFIGSHLCEKYISEGHNVICLDNFMTGNIRNIRSLIHKNTFKLINGDIRDFDLMEKIMPGVDVIVNLAAQIHVDRSVVEPKTTYDINVHGTQNVLESARMHDVKKIIHASTSEVYGSAQYAPIDEKHPLEAPHPYGASKIAGDRMCYSYLHTYGMNITIMRLFNVFGPRQKDVGYGGVISIFTRRVLNNMAPIIYGDGTQTRDYTYIADAVKAYDCALKYTKPITEPINFGTGREVSILTLANMIIELAGKKGIVQPVHVQPRIGEVKRLIADASKAKKILKWTPTYDFKKGLKEFIEWYKNYGFEN